jgi:hypothetical protein
LIEFRSTPRTDSYSPSQVFYGRGMKTDAPITAADLRTRTDLSAAESARQRVSDSKQNSANSQSMTRPDMIAGQTVSVQNPTTKRRDKRGIIVKARDPRNRTFQVKVDGTIWTRSEIFLRPVHIPLTDPFCALTGPQRSVCDPANFPRPHSTSSSSTKTLSASPEEKRAESCRHGQRHLLDADADAGGKRRKSHHCQRAEKKKKKGRGSSSSHQPAVQVSTGYAAWAPPSCSLVRCKQQQLPWD